MTTSLLNTHRTDAHAESHRHAYNAAFEELGLGWYWDDETWASVQGRGGDGVRSYLESEQAHLLRAYEADFLVAAIEAAKRRSHACLAITRRHVTPPPVVRCRPVAQAA
jgi:hypothetical protein